MCQSLGLFKVYRKLSFGLYSNDQMVTEGKVRINIHNPNFDYSFSYNGGEILVGDYALSTQYSDMGYGMIYDWDNPYGQYSSDIKATSVELINDSDTPDAFINDSNDDYVLIKAQKKGHTVVKVNYYKPDGYVDNNPNGYCTVQYTALNELMEVGFESSLGDNSEVLPGTTFDVKATFKSSVKLDNGETWSQNSERNITCDWFSGPGSENNFTYKIDENDPSICHITVLDNAATDSDYEYIYMTYSYTDSDGNKQTNAGLEEGEYRPFSYQFNIKSCYYRIDCELPDKLDMGETITVKPELKAVSNSGETIVPNANWNIYANSSGLNITNNYDGTITIYRENVGYSDSVRFTIYAYANGSSVEKYCIIGSQVSTYQHIEIVDSFLIYDGFSDVKFCANMSGVTAPYDDVLLYLDNGGNRTVIDKSFYSARKFDDVIYFTLSSKWFEQNPDMNSQSIDVVATNNGKDVTYSYVNLVKDYSNYNSKPFELLNNTIVVNQRVNIYAGGIYNVDGIGYDFVLDSLVEEGNNIMKFNKDGDYWCYYATKSGKTKVTSYYHYYKDGQRVDGTTTSSVIVRDCDYTISVESEDNGYKFVGGTYYYDINYYKIVYDDNGVQVNQEIDCPYRYECSLDQNGDHIPNVKLSMDSASRMKVEINDDCTDEYAFISVNCYDSDGNYILSTGTGFGIYKDCAYQTYLDEIDYNEDEPWKVTIKPYVYEYTKDNPNGREVSSEYNLSISCDKSDVTSVQYNIDGTVTLCNYSDKLNERNDITFTWTPKQSANRETLTDVYPINYSFFHDEENPEIKKSQSISLLDSDNVGLNIYWDTINLKPWVKAKISVEGEPNNYWYQELVRDDSKSTDDGFVHYKITVKLSSGQLAKNIKVQLVNTYNDKVVDEFTTSVASYAKTILDSNDSSYTKYKPLIKAMLNYGAASQNYFGYGTDKLANSCLLSSDQVVNDIPQKDIDRYNINKKLNIDGLTYYGSSLVLGSKITMRHYFKLEDGRDISNYRISIFVKDGNNSSFYDCNLKKKEGDLYYIETTKSIKSFFERPDILISDGHESEYFLYSPMNYIAKAYTKGNMDSKFKTLVDAMYWMEYEKSQLNN